MKPPDSTEAGIQAFETVCRRLAGFDVVLDPEWVDGFLTAVAAGPLALDTADWLPRMCGDAFERAFADPVDEAQGRGALEARLAVLRRQLEPEALVDEPDAIRLSPYLLEEEAPPEGESPLPPGLLWADGFLSAQDAFADEWTAAGADDEALALRDELLETVGMLVLPDDAEALATHLARVYPGSDPTRDDLIADALVAVQDLRVWWLDFAPRPATRHVAPRPGRNDPCPCGSGLKFKRCHGAG